ncbi:MAG: 5'-methylthioadenosine/S-adenosylhomocysteine nucleosidase [Lachnospiraceae bacterium]|nr:5'-methylthioadenosine/S-adenosylhomocysteine nucleosidase [Lachnospiraceae bacterium]
MSERLYQTDVALMTVTMTEFRGVMHFHNWKAKTFANDDQIYDVAEFERDGKKRSLVHAKIDEMGMTAAAATAMKMIYTFRPHYLIMVGIAAGIAKKEYEEQMYGDVIVPDIVWNYSSGKFVNPEMAEIRFGDLGFLPRSTSAAIPEEILPYLRRAVESDDNPCHAHIGPMACGSTVVANQKILDKQIYSQYRHTAGLDMESYAVVYTANHATTPRPIPIIVKSVCDFADSKKTDEFQRFAAYSSCEFAKYLYEKVLPMEE